MEGADENIVMDMKKIDTLEELKKVQLSILLSFHQYCSDNDIKYSLAAGTLIGAVRHKGFIPWDDDIDVYLLRPDYNKLVSLFPPTYQGRYCLYTLERDKKWNRAYGRFCDNTTLEFDIARNNYEGIGIGIDVFPIDDVPDDLLDWERFERKRRLIRDVITIKTMALSRKRSFFKNSLVFLSRIITWPFSFPFLTKLMDQYAQQNNGKGYSYVYENCLGVYNSKHPWLKKDLEEVVETCFEGHVVKIMKGYDDYLKTVYGDYMQIPPENKRVSTHTVTAYWK